LKIIIFKMNTIVQLFNRWKRSVYQLIWKHMLIYAIVYVSLSILYQFILNEDGKK
jgi:hypothetical protein